MDYEQRLAEAVSAALRIVHIENLYDDTISGIAKEYHVSIEAIEREMGWED